MDTSTPLPQESPPEILLGWNATSVPVHERGKQWYTIAGSLLLAGIAYGIVTGAWSFSVVLVLCGAIYFLLRNHVPDAKSIAFTQKAVYFDKQSLAYTELEGFWIIETPTYNVLHIRPKSHRKPEIVIQTSDVPLPGIRTILSQFCEEKKEKHESLVDIIIRICKL